MKPVIIKNIEIGKGLPKIAVPLVAFVVVPLILTPRKMA